MSLKTLVHLDKTHRTRHRRHHPKHMTRSQAATSAPNRRATTTASPVIPPSQQQQIAQTHYPSRSYVRGRCADRLRLVLGQGSSSSPASTQIPVSAQNRAASQVCSARHDIQTQVQTLTSLSTGSATKADVTSALSAIETDLQIDEGGPARSRSGAQAAGAGRGDGIRHAAEGPPRADGCRASKTDAQTQAKNAAASLESAVKESLQPIQC